MTIANVILNMSSDIEDDLSDVGGLFTKVDNKIIIQYPGYPAYTITVMDATPAEAVILYDAIKNKSNLNQK